MESACRHQLLSGSAVSEDIQVESFRSAFSNIILNIHVLLLLLPVVAVLPRVVPSYGRCLSTPRGALGSTRGSWRQHWQQQGHPLAWCHL